MPLEELEKEEFNSNIRRYVDNSPPAEPHDVYAHLHGGIPVAEVDSMADYWKNYSGLRENFFKSFKTEFVQYVARIDAKEDIKRMLDESVEIKAKHEGFKKSLKAWWKLNLPSLEALPKKQNVYDLYHVFSTTIAKNLSALGILDDFKSRGAFASYWNTLFTDLRSVSASGWNAELIPDEEILQSQFPDVLKELRDNETRRDELEALFEEVNDLEEGVWNEDDYEVWPKDELAEIRGRIKLLGGELKVNIRDFKNKEKQKKALLKSGGRILLIEKEMERSEGNANKLEQQITSETKRFVRHLELDIKLKQCRKVINEIKERKEKLVEDARKKINEPEAKRLILERWERTLYLTVDEYLAQYQHTLRNALENLWEKYHQPMHAILKERDDASKELVGYLKELGYE